MPQVRKLLIAIADGVHVRFVRPAATRAPHGPGGADAGAAAPGADRPWPAFRGPDAGSAAAGAHHDPHLLERQTVARVVAGQLNAAAQRQEFDDLVLIAPPRTLQTICGMLDATIRVRVVALEQRCVQAPDYGPPASIRVCPDRADASTAGAPRPERRPIPGSFPGD